MPTVHTILLGTDKYQPTCKEESEAGDQLMERMQGIKRYKSLQKCLSEPSNGVSTHGQH